MIVNTASEAKSYILHGPSAARMCVSIKFKANLNWTLDNLIQQNMWTRQVSIVGARANKLLLCGASLYQKPVRLSGDVGNTLTILGQTKLSSPNAKVTPTTIDHDGPPMCMGEVTDKRRCHATSAFATSELIQKKKKNLLPFQNVYENTPT